MNRRNTLMLVASALSGCGTSYSTIQPDPRMLVDDGISEIMPIYVMTYVDGQSSAFVRANFYFFDAKKHVQLRPRGSIKVNGTELEHDPDTLTSYIGRIPMPHELLTFEFTRSAGHVIRHSFALPELNITEFPRVYKVGEKLRVGVRHLPPRAGAGRDRYGLNIYNSSGRFDFAVEPAGESVIAFRPLLKVGFGAGRSVAHITRQQQTQLAALSDEIPRGWAVASRSRDIEIEVVN